LTTGGVVRVRDGVVDGGDDDDGGREDDEGGEELTEELVGGAVPFFLSSNNRGTKIAAATKMAMTPRASRPKPSARCRRRRLASSAPYVVVAPVGGPPASTLAGPVEVPTTAVCANAPGGGALTGRPASARCRSARMSPAVW
jgi:hypothetical protein